MCTASTNAAVYRGCPLPSRRLLLPSTTCMPAVALALSACSPQAELTPALDDLFTQLDFELERTQTTAACTLAATPSIPSTPAVTSSSGGMPSTDAVAARAGHVSGVHAAPLSRLSTAQALHGRDYTPPTHSPAAAVPFHAATGTAGAAATYGHNCGTSVAAVPRANANASSLVHGRKPPCHPKSKQRKPPVRVPLHLRDNTYRARRKRNTEAARKCRERKRTLTKILQVYTPGTRHHSTSYRRVDALFLASQIVATQAR